MTVDMRMDSINHKAGRYWRGLQNGTRIMIRGLSSVVTDLRVFARHHGNKSVFRQASFDGIQMVVRANEDVGRQIFCLQAFEQEETEYLRANIRKDDLCVDVGANVGYYTLLLGSLAKRGQVHSFEPVPLSYHLLESNSLINGFRNVVANQVALADSDSEEEFVVAQDSAFSSLLDTGRRPIQTTIRVPTMTLDHYCEQRMIGKIDFLKVDVEGAEEKVLRGAAGLLSDPARRPRLVLLELYEPMLRKYASGIDAILDRMALLGYRPFIYHKGQAEVFSKQYYGLFCNVFFSPHVSAQVAEYKSAGAYLREPYSGAN